MDGNYFGKAAKQYWIRELQNMLGIQSGSMSPTDLPEYKSMATQYNAQANQFMNRLMQQLGQRGITGGAAAGALSNANENAMSGLLTMIQNMYGNAVQRGQQAANTGLDWQKFRMMLAQEWQKQHDQRQAWKDQMTADIIGKVLGGVAGATSMLGDYSPLGNVSGSGTTGGLAATGDLWDYYRKAYPGNTFWR